jgi:alpha-D-ribose 1-methylphosphonate 5-triphosphate synthase subunit PhnL
MKSIHRTYLPSSGTVHYRSSKFGVVDLATANEHLIIELRKKEITYCSQFLRVIPRVPAVDIVAESIIKKEADRPRAREKTRELLSSLGLPKEIWDAFPSTFSGGEQQRINVARAIISKPRFLLIDEPTASLDPQTKEVVINLILDLKKYGTSVLCISHDQATLDKLTDRTIHLEKGQVVENVAVE